MTISLSDMVTKKRVRTPDPEAGMPHGAMMEHETYTCYILRGITFIPHYRERVYVSPAYGLSNFDTYLAIELKALGAKPVELALWKRSQFGN
jgi:hypothetical protein